MRYGFTILDVFTSVPFGANQLALLPALIWTWPMSTRQLNVKRRNHEWSSANFGG